MQLTKKPKIGDIHYWVEYASDEFYVDVSEAEVVALDPYPDDEKAIEIEIINVIIKGDATTDKPFERGPGDWMEAEWRWLFDINKPQDVKQDIIHGLFK